MDLEFIYPGLQELNQEQLRELNKKVYEQLLEKVDLKPTIQTNLIMPLPYQPPKSLFDSYSRSLRFTSEPIMNSNIIIKIRKQEND